MPTERNAQILAQIAILAEHVARLDADDVPVIYVSTSGSYPSVNLAMNHFRAVLAGREVVVKHSGNLDSYRAEVDGVSYEALDYMPERAPATTETIRLPGGDLAAK